MYASLLVVVASVVALVQAVDNAPITTPKPLLWGPYRSNLYFGIKPRIPKSVSFGLMWTTYENEQLNLKQLRHSCEQSDNLAHYGWTNYDVRSGGVQTISDPKNCLDLKISFVKGPEDGLSPDWAFRLKGDITCGHPRASNVSIIFYIGLENELEPGTSRLQCQRSSAAEDIECDGETPRLGTFSIQMPAPDANENHHTSVRALMVPEDQVWDAKTHYMRNSRTLRNRQSSHDTGRLIYIERSFTSDFEYDVIFSSGTNDRRIQSYWMDNSVDSAVSNFNKQFDSVFQPQMPFEVEGYKKFSKSILSDLLGGIGYFYGSNKVDRSLQSPAFENGTEFWTDFAEALSHAKPELSKPAELFSAVPSRQGFPRSFLWDEGFHLQLITDWDLDLAVEIIQSWLAVMEDSGWIAREQILGAEAQSKVPPEFQIQYPYYANPPTMFLAAEAILNKLSGSSKYHGQSSVFMENQIARQRLVDQVYHKLKKHYTWWKQSQKGPYPQEAGDPDFFGEVYTWRGRMSKHILTSGLDDYPRAQPQRPHEFHVDALAWVGTMTTVLSRFAGFIGNTEEQIGFEQTLQNLRSSLDQLHWSEQASAYCDFYVEGGQRVHVCHKGYVTLLPLLGGLLEDNHPNVGKILDLMAGPNELWSPHGLRSLSVSDQFHGEDENYWRGPIWININYLAIRNLLALALEAGPHQERARQLYTQLRQNVVTTVYDSWKSTGFAWEQYNQDTGKGQRTQHFTGWTALVVKILSLPQLGEQSLNQQNTMFQKYRYSNTSWMSVWAMGVVLVGFSFYFRRFMKHFRRGK